MIQTDHPVVFFDGICNLCNGAVQFVIRHDPKGKLRFASLQSDFARETLLQFGRDPSALYSMMVLTDNKLLDKSDAVLQIAFSLGWPWRVFSIFRIVPRFLRNACYDFIASRRYRWFGRRNECMIPTPELKSRFLG